MLAVTPNNPTGSILRDADADELVTRAAATPRRADPRRGVHRLSAGRDAARGGRACDPPCLTFRLGGLSKTVGLPQLKLGWIAVHGPEPLVAEAMDRLELICDTYLSVSTPVQLAARRLLEQGAGSATQILARVRAQLPDARARRLAPARQRAAGRRRMVGRDAPAGHPVRRSACARPSGSRCRRRPSRLLLRLPPRSAPRRRLLPVPEQFARGVQLLQNRLNAA